MVGWEGALSGRATQLVRSARNARARTASKEQMDEQMGVRGAAHSGLDAPAQNVRTVGGVDTRSSHRIDCDSPVHSGRAVGDGAWGRGAWGQG